MFVTPSSVTVGAVWAEAWTEAGNGSDEKTAMESTATRSGSACSDGEHAQMAERMGVADALVANGCFLVGAE